HMELPRAPPLVAELGVGFQNTLLMEFPEKLVDTLDLYPATGRAGDEGLGPRNHRRRTGARAPAFIEGGPEVNPGRIAPEGGEAGLLVDQREAEFIAIIFHAPSDVLHRQGRNRAQHLQGSTLRISGVSASCPSEDT